MSTNKKSDDAAEAAAEESAPDATFLIMFFAFVAIGVLSVFLDGHLPEESKPVMLLVSRVALRIFFAGAGWAHFDESKDELYCSMIPPFFPNPSFLHKCAGAFELAGGVGLVIPIEGGIRNASAWLLICVLWGVFPANMYHVYSPEARSKLKMPLVFAWIRIAVQFIFMEWARVHTTSSLEELLGV